MKKEILTGLTVATVALTAGARPCGPGFGGHHGFHGGHFGGPRFHGAPHHFYGGWGHAGRYGWPAIGGFVAGAWAARAYSDAVWAAQGFRPVYGYGYGVVAPTVVSSPVVYQQPVQQVVYQQPTPQVVYQQPAPIAQPAPQPQEVRIVVEHQYPNATQVNQNAAQQQRVQ